MKGLQERQLLRSTEDPDEGISVSIWDSMEDLLEYERGEFRQSLAKEVEHLYRGEYWVKHFEVTTWAHRPCLVDSSKLGEGLRSGLGQSHPYSHRQNHYSG